MFFFPTYLFDFFSSTLVCLSFTARWVNQVQSEVSQSPTHPAVEMGNWLLLVLRKERWPDIMLVTSPFVYLQVNEDIGTSVLSVSKSMSMSKSMSRRGYLSFFFILFFTTCPEFKGKIGKTFFPVSRWSWHRTNVFCVGGRIK